MRKYADARFQSSTTCPCCTLLRDCGGGSVALLESARERPGGMALGKLTNSTLEAKAQGLLLLLLMCR